MKSNVSDYLEVVQAVYIDACAKCTADVFDLRDLETIRSRVEDEGLSFLTITLPMFARDFERSLANMAIDSTLFRNFRKCGAIPAFLQGMTSRLFDSKTGELLRHEHPRKDGGSSSDFPTLVESVRQICLTFKKVEIDCTPERVQAALESFVSTEQSFEAFSPSEETISEFLEVSSVLWDNLVAGYTSTDMVPRHGPGATAEHVSGNRKFAWQRWHDRLEPYFPLLSNGYPLGLAAERFFKEPERSESFGETYWEAEELRFVTVVPRESEQPVRVVTVPKTLKGPRIIAVEPCCMQYVQQGIRDFLYRSIESYWLTKRHINFRDQSKNQRLAMRGSRLGQLATIDLSDASDRVPRDLALEMFRANPELRDAIDACRSTHAELPDGRRVGPLRKFASMGSALCFPIEAMYFYTVCVVALLKANGLSCTPGNVLKVSRRLYVYGDDIIVPSANAVSVLDHLQKYNCKVNANKSFWSGSFRESCGVDAYAGYEVTPTYLRHERPKNRRQASQIISWVATGNQFYKKGYWKTAAHIWKQVERIVGELPYVSEDSECLGRISYLGFTSIERWGKRYQRYEIYGWVPRPVYRADPLEGYAALALCLSAPAGPLWTVSRKGSRDTIKPVAVADKRRLERSAQHGAVTLKRRWAPA